jgi:drug/metabolite transporter (DMT)-like permease
MRAPKLALSESQNQTGLGGQPEILVVGIDSNREDARVVRPDCSVAPDAQSLVWTAVAPALFVFLWSTGFIGGKAGLPYAEPLTFLGVRFAIAAVLMLIAALLARAAWPKGVMIAHVAVVGFLMHSLQLGGVFSALQIGLPAGFAALIIGLQPILIAAVVGPLLGERVSPSQWVGFILGFGGAALVLGERYGLAAGSAGLAAPALAVCGLFGGTAGTLYQKRYCADANLWTATVIQYAAATVPVMLVAARFESMQITWSLTFIAALAWLVLGLSVGAICLLYLLIRRGAISKLASYYFLVPPTTALIAWAMFGEHLGLQALAGMAIAAAGVAIVQKG